MKSTSPGGSPSAPVIFDPFVSVPGTDVLRDAAIVQDWPALRRHLEDARDADGLAFGVDVLAELPGLEVFLEKVLAEEPHDVLARTLLAARYVRIGWWVRGRGDADSVSGDQFEQFHSWLRRAEQILVDVCAERPDLAPAWTTRIMTARGLELGQAEARRRYTRLAVHHPHVLAAQEQLLQQLCPKWSGSWEIAMAFAREVAAAAPPGAPSGAVIATMYIERWLAESEADAPEIASPAARDELCAAGTRTAWASATSLGPYEVHVHSAFALAFSLGGHARDAAPHFRVLGNRTSSHVWSYLNDPSAAFWQFHSAALAAETGAT
ncbi:hypothetical protein HP550_02600 [Cellulomonas humilata]|uniref:DUF4034 domain-containing protein n=1 Tax=Cellulomonas humilata TaxID=144055 RepID=A0A7Y5ZZK8_9CELL|nr:hypothetical protein [Cellulomonas humilata]NUU16140.1 hypothetical protein [Cellulomonas humilata]